ncbi:MAG: anti-sigma factor [Acidimicrobiales bacterium]|nr:anti-sigma factor [Acidimicrobiales bacterium]MCB9394361.1 anti-sigma factor [Acidimicrobiaceae bacterium]
MSSDIDIHHLGAAYTLDALDERERMAFEAHYPSCDVCRADVLAFRAALAQVASAQTTPPPRALKAAVMAEVARTRQLSPLLPDRVSDLAERRRRRQRTIGGFLAAAAAVVLVLGAAVVLGRGGEPAYATALAQVLDAPDGTVLTLEPSDAMGAGASVKVAWSAQEGMAVVIADGLPATPTGMAYELWFIGSGDPEPMGMLERVDAGELHAVLDIDGDPTAWGVTVEPDGGSPAPTGDILFLGAA